MGCSSSSAGRPSLPSKPKRKSNKSAKDDDAKDISDQDVNKMREDILQRHDSEVDLMAQISAEREALRAISTVKIERSISCESLFGTFTQEELNDSVDENYGHYIIQQKSRTALLLKALAKKSKKWVIYNNLAGLKEGELQELATFLLHIIRALQDRRIAMSGHDSSKEIGPKAAASIGKLHNRYDISRFQSLDKAIKSLPIVTLAPVSHYTITEKNRYDFDLPPGLVTIQEAKLIIELYKQGGKLVPSAVHKLLRLSYKHLKQQANTSKMVVRIGEKLNVVGDLHGQLADLFHILDSAGLPSRTNKYIFNGDFVDRGSNGVEVMCVLLSLVLSAPDCVVLNRGNHEDFAICSVYGFQLEVYEKYDPLTFGLFVEVFQQISLFAIVNDSIFVVHGGLFHTENATLQELNRIDRTAFTLEEMPDEGESLEGISRDHETAFLQQLIRDALWSDPVDRHGKHPSARGAGLSFGPDVVEKFLLRNKLKFVIRSHECVRSGYEEPYANTQGSQLSGPMLCTIFSASDYGGSGNSAAYLELSLVPKEELMDEKDGYRNRRASRSLSRQYSVSANTDCYSPTSYASPSDNTSEIKRVLATDLQYIIHYFYASPLRFYSTGLSQPHRETIFSLSDLPSEFSSEATNNVNGMSNNVQSKDLKREYVLVGSSLTLEEHICTKKHNLLEAFEKIDTASLGYVSQQDWLRIMTDILGISLSWRRMARYLIKEEMLTATNLHGTSVKHPTNASNIQIKYLEFLHVFDDEFVFRSDRLDTESLNNMHTHSQMQSTSSNLEAKSFEAHLDDVAPEFRSNDEMSKDILPSLLNNEEISLLPNTDYFGHLITCDIIEALYSNHEKIQEAFEFLDKDEDNLVSLDELITGCTSLHMIHDQSAVVEEDPRSRIKQYSVNAIYRFMSWMDVHFCGNLDANVFFEMFRLSLLRPFLSDDQHWTKPILMREISHSHELYKLSHHITPIMSSQSSIPHSHSLLALQLGVALGPLELKKGVEIGVDSELIALSQDAADQLGLSIDI